jgi:hypothetical protein
LVVFVSPDCEHNHNDRVAPCYSFASDVIAVDLPTYALPSALCFLLFVAPSLVYSCILYVSCKLSSIINNGILRL